VIVKRPLGTRGLTLIEVVVATGVLSIVLTSMFGTLGGFQRAETMTRERQAAAQAAFRQLDLVGASSFSSLSGWNGAAFDVRYNDTLLPAASVPINTGGDADRCGRVVVVDVDLDGDGAAEDYDGDSTADLVEIRVQCAWRSVDGSDASFEAVTRRSR
jgi:prepilin-type N-terminal cleavage/methylation domain-containing protein